MFVSLLTLSVVKTNVTKSIERCVVHTRRLFLFVNRLMNAVACMVGNGVLFASTRSYAMEGGCTLFYPGTKAVKRVECRIVICKPPGFFVWIGGLQIFNVIRQAGFRTGYLPNNPIIRPFFTYVNRLGIKLISPGSISRPLGRSTSRF